MEEEARVILRDAVVEGDQLSNDLVVFTQDCFADVESFRLERPLRGVMRDPPNFTLD